MSVQRVRSLVRCRKVLGAFLDAKQDTCFRPLICQLNSTQQRTISTYEVKSGQKTESVFKKLIKKVPLFDTYRIKVKAAGFFLYEDIADKIDYIHFMKQYNLPDTFYSWFVITELHIWMLSARAMAEAEHGQLLRNSILEALWTDVAKRAKKLGSVNPSIAREQINELSAQLQTALIAYDEGLQSDDMVLAGALWRRMYQKNYAPPHHLEDLVRYIRKHMALLDTLSMEQLVNYSAIRWEGAHTRTV